MAVRPTITPQEGEELQRLFTELTIATARLAQAGKTDGAPLQGNQLQKVLEEEANLSAIVRRIKEILGTTGQHWMA